MIKMKRNSNLVQIEGFEPNPFSGLANRIEGNHNSLKIFPDSLEIRSTINQEGQSGAGVPSDGTELYVNINYQCAREYIMDAIIRNIIIFEETGQPKNDDTAVYVAKEVEMMGLIEVLYSHRGVIDIFYSNRRRPIPIISKFCFEKTDYYKGNFGRVKDVYKSQSPYRSKTCESPSRGLLGLIEDNHLKLYPLEEGRARIDFSRDMENQDCSVNISYEYPVSNLFFAGALHFRG
jgi:hypothetical protein